MKIHRLIFVSCFLLSALPLLASVPSVLSIEARLIPRVRAGTMFMEVSVTPHADSTTYGRIQLISRGDATEPVGDIREVTAARETTMRVLFDIEPSMSGTLGSIDVVWFSPVDPSVGLVHTVYLERVGRRLMKLEPQVYAAKWKKQQDDEEAARDEEEAQQAVGRLVAAGRRPGLVTGNEAELTPYERAWNRYAKPFARAAGVRALTCGVYNIVSPNNYTFTMNGNVGYVRGGGEQLLRTNGYPISIETMIEYTDGCGGYQQRTKSYQVQSSNFGYVYYGTITSIVNPQTGNPIRKMSASTGQVGLLTRPFAGSGNMGIYLQTETQTLTGSSLNYQWNGYIPDAGYIRPIYNSSNAPHYYYFAWQDEINKMRASWNDAGFQGYTEFRAVLKTDDTAPDPYFTFGRDIYGTNVGFIIFNENDAISLAYQMAHEIGHFLHYNLQGGGDHFCADSGIHDICTLQSDLNGFNEGFADWNASKFESSGRYLFVSCDGSECQSSCPTGYDYEGNVHDFFWDVFDASNSATYDNNQDPVSLPLSILHNWQNTTRCYLSFPAFFDDMSAKGAFSPYTSTDMNTLRVVNGVNQAQ